MWEHPSLVKKVRIQISHTFIKEWVEICTKVMQTAKDLSFKKAVTIFHNLVQTLMKKMMMKSFLIKKKIALILMMEIVTKKIFKDSNLNLSLEV